jgi:hypothetical protein
LPEETPIVERPGCQSAELVCCKFPSENVTLLNLYKGFNVAKLLVGVSVVWSIAS